MRWWWEDGGRMVGGLWEDGGKVDGMMDVECMQVNLQ